MSNTSRTDPRILRTRKLLREALIDLVPQKSYPEITIQDIADHSTLNRTTFYLHYQDKDDLMRDVFEWLVETGIPTPPPNLTSREEFEATKPITTILAHVQEYADFYRVMLGEQGAPFFMAQTRSYIETIAQSWLEATVLKLGSPVVSMEMMVNFVSSAFLGVILWWLETDMALPVDEMEKQLMRLTGQGVLGTVE